MRCIWACSLLLILPACGGDDDEGTSSTTVETDFTTASDDDVSSEDATTDESSDGAEEGGVLDMADDGYAGAYGPCEVYSDCSPASLWVCLVDVTAGGVCAPPCLEHSDCPAPEGGDVAPACTEVDGGKQCVLALCEGDDDCPEGMSCFEGGPYPRCHWAY